MPKPRKSSFKPSKYEGSNSIESIDEIASKDETETMKIDLSNIEDTLSLLRANDKKMIKELTGELDEKFRLFVSYVQLLYETDYYPMIYNLVKAKFSDLDEIRPGTIGAYLGGCLADIKINNAMPSCTPVTVRSMPPPKNSDSSTQWTFCDNTIIWAEAKADGHYNLTVLNQIPDSDRALIFVNETRAEDFPGFSFQEKDTLHRMGINEARIIGYTQSGRDYIDLTPAYQTLANLKTRIHPYVNDSEEFNLEPGPVEAKAAGGNNTGIILILIIIILILIFLVWRQSSRL